MIIFLDTETTGLHPGKICQLSYLLQQAGSVMAKNLFFAVDYVEPSAQAVHGFSVQKLQLLSEGKTFSDRFEEVRNDLAKADLIVTHNVAFDMMFLRAEFERNGQALPNYNTFCSMKNTVDVCKLTRKSGGYKYPKLSELCTFLGVADMQIAEQCKKLFGQRVGFHDARFDTTALFLAVNCAMGNIDKFENIKKYIQ